MFKFKNRYWSFKIEHKVFVTQLLRDGGGVRISERSRLRSFELEIDVPAAVWCLEILQEALTVEESKVFCRKYRGSNIVLLAEIFNNKNGMFLKFTKLSHGYLKNIIVPGGSSRWGWRRLLVCLDNLVGKRFWSYKRRSLQGGYTSKYLEASDKVRFHSDLNNWGKNHCSWREAVGSQAEQHKVKVNKKNWRDEVLVFRFTTFKSWNSIQSGLTKMLNFHRELTPLAADRAVLWCVNEEDKRKMEQLGLCFIPHVGEVKFVRWNPEAQLKNKIFFCSNSWMGIEGLPLNMWNKHVFKVIGRQCGGLLDIARCTLDFTCLIHAEIKLKGREGGLIPESMEVFCWGKKVQIKFFILNNYFSRFHGHRHQLGRLPKVEDEVSGVVRTEKLDLTTRGGSATFGQV